MNCSCNDIAGTPQIAFKRKIKGGILFEISVTFQRVDELAQFLPVFEVSTSPAVSGTFTLVDLETSLKDFAGVSAVYAELREAQSNTQRAVNQLIDALKREEEIIIKAQALHPQVHKQSLRFDFGS